MKYTIRIHDRKTGSRLETKNNKPSSKLVQELKETFRAALKAEEKEKK